VGYGKGRNPRKDAHTHASGRVVQSKKLKKIKSQNPEIFEQKTLHTIYF
jgi:hypothetical protein